MPTQADVEQHCHQLATVADAIGPQQAGLSMLLVASRQMVRLLWAEAHPPVEAAPPPPMEPPSDEPVPADPQPPPADEQQQPSATAS